MGNLIGTLRGRSKRTDSSPEPAAPPSPPSSPSRSRYVFVARKPEMYMEHNSSVDGRGSPILGASRSLLFNQPQPSPPPSPIITPPISPAASPNKTSPYLGRRQFDNEYPQDPTMGRPVVGLLGRQMQMHERSMSIDSGAKSPVYVTMRSPPSSLTHGGGGQFLLDSSDDSAHAFPPQPEQRRRVRSMALGSSSSPGGIIPPATMARDEPATLASAPQPAAPVDGSMSLRELVEMGGTLSPKDLGILTQGGVFMKYGRKGRPKRRWVQVTPDLMSISWRTCHSTTGHGGSFQSQTRKPPRYMPLATVLQISRGHKTPVFIKAAHSTTAPLGLSLVWGSRTLDLEAHTEELRDMWAASLQSLVTYSIHTRSS
eukprot:TRINITY_DN13051_c0_g2_i1.p1 TRINITY_DN13051_c0_g2~~TRINITY_DN13051_c0_g2_i1.p1  ORF type:complete len:411 (+),score=103.36 TRINITY_DN13051_c0_g2_i1:122-1234(+)